VIVVASKGGCELVIEGVVRTEPVPASLLVRHRPVAIEVADPAGFCGAPGDVSELVLDDVADARGMSDDPRTESDQRPPGTFVDLDVTANVPKHESGCKPSQGAADDDDTRLISHSASSVWAAKAVSSFGPFPVPIPPPDGSRRAVGD
jgi:hypothetical protein